MKRTCLDRRRLLGRCNQSGFALVVTLSLMILLTIIAVGLLTLSSVTLRTSSQGNAIQEARANARVALMLAIGDLQKQLGPDTRVSVTADQIAASGTFEESSAPQSQRHWAGAYKAWPEGPPSASRPSPEFLQWFVSGNPDSVKQRTYATTMLGTGTNQSVEIVTPNTVGPDGDPVRVPLVTQTASGGAKNKFAWWASDLGTKALISQSAEIPTSIAEARMGQQAAPALNVNLAESGTMAPFKSLALTDPNLAKLATWQSGALVADSPQNIRGLFHDLTARSSGLLTNVRSGGFRKDLSMELERRTSPPPTPLYQVGGETGINLQELWAYYTSYKEVRHTGSANFTTGGRLSSGSPYLMLERTAAACQSDDYFFFKQPVIISYQVAFSFQTRVQMVNGTQMRRLYLVADPIITFWNPLDVPVMVPGGTAFSIKYWQIPYDLYIGVNNGAPQRYPLAATLSNARSGTGVTSTDGDGNFMSLQVGKLQQMVFKPGEIIKMSQSGSTLAIGSVERHKLGGKAGFNFGSGVEYPVTDLTGKTVDLKPTDQIVYQVRPNNLTAGKKGSGNSVTGNNTHTRHFSLSHHEYYIGDDRGNDSLGIGGMFIDWDFGNRRLKPNENRGTSAPGVSGTKPAGERLYANKFPGIFRNLEGSDVRPLNASDITNLKAPFMLISYNAKTENGSDRGTRFLSRFNPKALHVDFYDLSEEELDMLPYEFSVEPLASWKNRSLEVSSKGGAFYGGGLNAQFGTEFVTTHSVPREPIVSLAALQFSFANGFEMQRPKYGYATLNAREPMMPQIAHAIGNSMACPVLGSGETEGTLAGGRPLADHSYLANQALWDDWFFSGIAPQTIKTFGQSRSQQRVAQDFFSGTAPLPEIRYQADLRGRDPDDLAKTYIPGSSSTTIPASIATDEIASYIRVNGMFNVNSTSVEAWKCLLGGLKDRPVVIRDSSGKESVSTAGDGTPVSALQAPEDLIVDSSGSSDVKDPDQWIGRRTLTDDQIEDLARGLVKEVRKRGPFLSLADFVNRRAGPDKELARSGAIQSVLDSAESDINKVYGSGSRAVPETTASRFEFPEAEEGALAFGSPGIVKQADILTPIAPVLSARSDSFLIRAYGEKVDASGRVLARAWCEAVVQRSAEFVDPSDAPEARYATISTINNAFGRRFDIVSFRWLDSTDA
jgi:hypothetical protein